MSYTHPDSMRGQVAIITGAAQGVGKGIAAALLERGAAVFLVDILEDKLAATTDELKA
ncbi:MAG: SDR family NAD(P)-dependent oxidoreductase, partial [Mycobacterium sp.]